MLFPAASTLKEAVVCGQNAESTAIQLYLTIRDIKVLKSQCITGFVASRPWKCLLFICLPHFVPFPVAYERLQFWVISGIFHFKAAGPSVLLSLQICVNDEFVTKRFACFSSARPEQSLQDYGADALLLASNTLASGKSPLRVENDDMGVQSGKDSWALYSVAFDVFVSGLEKSCCLSVLCNKCFCIFNLGTSQNAEITCEEEEGVDFRSGGNGQKVPETHVLHLSPGGVQVTAVGFTE